MKDKHLQIRLNDFERFIIEQEAKKFDMSMSQYVVMKVISHTTGDLEDYYQKWVLESKGV